jgi:gamma-carbonic anhydrase
MPVYQYKTFTPEIGPEAFIADGAHVIGRTTLGSCVSIWQNVVVRGDVNYIEIGDNCNIQDLSMLHVTEEFPLIIEENVSVGHNAILHACTIKRACLIGMGAIVLDGAVIGESSVVAAGSVVPPGKVFPGKSMIMGSPAKVVRALTDEEIDQYSNHYKSYQVTRSEYLNDLVKL